MPKSSNILVLVDVRSAHNVGAIARSAAAFNVTSLWCVGITPYPNLHRDSRLPHVQTRATTMIAKTALGADQIITFRHFSDVNIAFKQLRRRHYHLYALEQSERSTPIKQFKPELPWALVVGNEVKGLNQSVLDQTEQIIEIPLSGPKQSLNVAVAAGIALFQFSE